MEGDDAEGERAHVSTIPRSARTCSEFSNHPFSRTLFLYISCPQPRSCAITTINPKSLPNYWLFDRIGQSGYSAGCCAQYDVDNQRLTVATPYDRLVYLGDQLQQLLKQYCCNLSYVSHLNWLRRWESCSEISECIRHDQSGIISVNTCCAATGVRIFIYDHTCSVGKLAFV